MYKSKKYPKPMDKKEARQLNHLTEIEETKDGLKALQDGEVK